MAEVRATQGPNLTPTRTELVWPEKCTQVERVALPFQVVETINQSRATREQTPMLAGLPTPPLFDGQTTSDNSWKNKLIWGENKYIMASLLQGDPSIGLEPLAGKVNLIYIDPPFATGQNFSYKARVGDEEWLKEASIIEETAYRDFWGRGLDSYLQMMYERLVLMRELLAATGTIYVHMDYHVGHYVKLILDQLFGEDNYRNEVIWNKGFRGTESKRIYQHSHDSIYWYSKSNTYTWNEQGQPYRDESMGRYNQIDDEGRRFALIKRRRTDGTVYYGRTYPKDQGKSVNDVIEHIPVMAATSSERVGFDTQKPDALLELFISASSNPGDLVADLFCGSGTTMAIAEKLKRRWIGCDLSRYAIQVTRKRMLDIPDCKPFQILNLGKYERKHWQVNLLNGEQEDSSKAITDYLRFIVALYHAEHVDGYANLHGQKAGRWVYVGAADAPVTRGEIMDAVHECQANRYTALDVLGWEWEMGLHDTVRDEARRMGVDLRLLFIPREVMDKRAVEAGDVHFYELAYLKTSLLQDGRMVTVRLEDFIIPNPDLVPDDVRSKIKKWSDYIDFWAVDWNYQGDTFHNEWQTYRTRKTPTLRLISDPYTYAEAGSYHILVKVIDIFGNDTTQLLEVTL